MQILTNTECYKHTCNGIKELPSIVKNPFYTRAKQLMIDIAERYIELYAVSLSNRIVFSIPSSCVSAKACEEFKNLYEEEGWAVHFDEAYGNITVVLSTTKLED